MICLDLRSAFHSHADYKKLWVNRVGRGVLTAPFSRRISTSRWAEDRPPYAPESVLIGEV